MNYVHALGHELKKGAAHRKTCLYARPLRAATRYIGTQLGCGASAASCCHTQHPNIPTPEGCSIQLIPKDTENSA